MNRPWALGTRNRTIATATIALAALVAAVVLLPRLGRRTTTLERVTTEAVERRDIAVTVEATGTVEPINLVEVKSKASGQITRMPVEIGTSVAAGDLLAQVDPRDVRNAYDQSRAALVAAQARAAVSREQRQRAEELFREQVITAGEREAAQLEDANARSQLVAARTNLDLARQRLEDATVRAPIAGTVLEKPVSVGQVISSATSSVSGGTTLLKMADLSRIRVRALVAESDIGKVREAQEAAVVVDAYPNRTFRGRVEKIEPQAVVQQSVTMFPVLVTITNEERLLLPGMNGEVTMQVEERNDVLSVPVDAVRTLREFTPIAQGLGVDVDSLQARARAAALAARGADAGRDSLRAAATSANGAPRDTAATRRWRQARAARPGASVGGDRAGGNGAVAPNRAAAGGAGGWGGSRNGGLRTQVAVVQEGGRLVPRVVRVGLTNYDYAEILSGLEEGEQVVMLGVLEMQQQRDETVSRVRSRASGGLTTTPSGTPGGAGSRPGNAGGGR